MGHGGESKPSTPAYCTSFNQSSSSIEIQVGTYAWCGVFHNSSVMEAGNVTICQQDGCSLWGYTGGKQTSSFSQVNSSTASIVNCASSACNNAIGCAMSGSWPSTHDSDAHGTMVECMQVIFSPAPARSANELLLLILVVSGFL